MVIIIDQNLSLILIVRLYIHYFLGLNLNPPSPLQRMNILQQTFDRKFGKDIPEKLNSHKVY